MNILIAEITPDEWTKIRDLLNTTSPYDWAQLAINAVVALGTIAVAVLAIWGNWIQAKWFGPIVTIEPHDLKGSHWPSAGGRLTTFFYLKAKNARHWSAAKGVRVVLTDLEVRTPDHRFHRFNVPIPWQFCWTPSETAESVQTITDERVFDFGFLLGPEVEQQVGAGVIKLMEIHGITVPPQASGFWPKWYSQPIKLDYFMMKSGMGGTIRYHLRAVGENFHCKNSTVVEVSWDGIYTEDLTELPKHLQISIVTKGPG